MHKTRVQINVIPLAALAVMLSLLLGSSSALAQCPNLTGTWQGRSNSTDITLNLRLILGTAGWHIGGTIVNDNSDPHTTYFSGYVECETRPMTIEFARVYPDWTNPIWIQDYEGVLIDRCTMQGTFTHNDGAVRYLWWAQKQPC